MFRHFTSLVLIISFLLFSYGFSYTAVSGRDSATDHPNIARTVKVYNAGPPGLIYVEYGGNQYGATLQTGEFIPLMASVVGQITYSGLTENNPQVEASSAPYPTASLVWFVPGGERHTVPLFTDTIPVQINYAEGYGFPGTINISNLDVAVDATTGESISSDNDSDWDNDGIMDPQDPDDDNDGILDINDLEPHSPLPGSGGEGTPPGGGGGGTPPGDGGGGTPPGGGGGGTPPGGGGGGTPPGDGGGNPPPPGGGGVTPPGGGGGGTGPQGPPGPPGEFPGVVTTDGSFSQSGYVDQSTIDTLNNSGPSTSDVINQTKGALSNLKLLEAGTLPRASGYSLSLAFGKFGQQNIYIDFNKNPFPVIRAGILVVMTMIMANALLKRCSI